MIRLRTQGLTLPEVLLALTIIGIAFTAILSVQLGSFRSTAQTQNLSILKAATIRVIEDLTTTVLNSDPTLTASSNPLTQSRASYFGDYYWGCPTLSTSTTNPLLTPVSGVTPIRITQADCQGTSGNTAWTIEGESGLAGEGTVLLRATATDANTGRSFSLTSRVSCYDAYPIPQVTAPASCPATLLATGGGR